MKIFISYWHRVLEEWINILMEELHAVFYQVVSCQSCWPVVAAGLVMIEFEVRYCFTGLA